MTPPADDLTAKSDYVATAPLCDLATLVTRRLPSHDRLPASPVVLCLILFALGMHWPAQAFAQLPSIYLDSIFPQAAAVDQQVRVTIQGEHTESATQLLFSHPGISATQEASQQPEFLASGHTPGAFLINVAPNVKPGRYDVRALGPTGMSGPLSFMVSHLQSRTFDPPTSSFQAPHVIAVEEAVNVRTRADQKDYFQFAAKSHRPLLIQVFADRIDSNIDAILSIYGPDGKRHARMKQSLTRDPICTFTPPVDGKYTIEVQDATYQDGGVYRLELTEQPWIESVFPLAYDPDSRQQFTIYGYNLQKAESVPGFEQSGLQTTQLVSAPQDESGHLFRDGSTAGWSSTRDLAAAWSEGQYWRIGGRYTKAPPVFLLPVKHSLTLENEEVSSAEQAQTLTLPADVVGRFFPRRDRDWYQFKATKNQTLWIQLASQQLGFPTDPVLSIQQRIETKGAVRFRNIAVADDIEPLPRTRDRRRFNTATADASYRFQVPADGTYVISLVDQFNSLSDDPRLAYRLSIGEPAPSFQLVALTEPERFPDEKTLKPKGTALLAGGSQPIRVRLLPRQGFAGTVTVQATDLPDSIHAAPLTLDESNREGLLVLQADRQARPSSHTFTIVGTSKTSTGSRRQVVASSAAIVRGANNADVSPVVSRLTRNQPLTILATKPAPITLCLNHSDYHTCIGGSIPIHVQLDRRDDFAEAVQVAPLSLPKGLQIAAQSTDQGQLALVANVDSQCVPGHYAVVLAAKVKDVRPTNPVVTANRKAYFDQLTQQLSQSRSLFAQQQSKLKQQKQDLSAHRKLLASARQRSQEPRRQLKKLLQDELGTAKRLAIELGNAAHRTSPAALETVFQLEDHITESRDTRRTLAAKWATTEQEISELSKQQTVLQDYAAQLESEQAKLSSRKTELEKKHAAAKKQWADAKSADRKKAEFWVYAPTITLTIERSPVTVETSSPQIQPGQPNSLAVLLERRFGFQGQSSVRASFPKQDHLFAAPIVIGPGLTSGKLTLMSSVDTKPGSYPGLLHIETNFNDCQITQDVPIQVHVGQAFQDTRQ